MNDADFLATLTDDVSSVSGLRAAWMEWARDAAPDDAPPDDAWFARLADRRAAAARARGTDAPLIEWRFTGTLRRSQRALLEEVEVCAPEPLHIVAPPGAGKTLLGLLLAARRGVRTVVFAPTTTIQRQWAQQARELAPDPSTVSEDPDALGDLTVLTYQRISVPDRGEAFEPLARDAWIAELVEAGRSRRAADGWLVSLADSNSRAYRAGIRRRASAARRRMAKESPERLAASLHPNARALVDALVDHGVRTAVLDECHHLLDHWALVIAYLESRIRAAGEDPLLIGLTATVPSAQDATGFENYSALLGDVDVEQPTPAVVREGNLAPYRDIAWFTQPTAAEQVFLAENERLLAALIANTLGTPQGVAHLHRLLTGAEGEPVDVAAPEAEIDLERRIGEAYARDFAMAEAAAAMLAIVAPDDALLSLLPSSTLVIGDGEMRLLARFLLETVLPHPERAEDWSRARRTLADFGYALTDRGIRRARDPIDTMLSTSAAKDDAVADILEIERERMDDRLRAVVVCDFAEHGNVQGRGRRAGALRTFARIVSDDRFVDLMPVLVTARHLRVATRDLGMLLPRLQRELGVVPELAGTDDDGTVSELSVPGVTQARVVGAVSSLIAVGFVRVVVGTRGLLGEGWDCPAVNTLIDLTTASTSTASQQLRGRTMRLDPAWPEKVAHNWTVVAVHPSSRSRTAGVDLDRLRRKLAPLWGVRVSGDADVVRGAEHTLSSAQRDLVRRLRRGEAPGDVVELLNRCTVDELPARETTRERWQIGSVVDGHSSLRAVTPSSLSPRALLVPTVLESALARVAATATAIGTAAVATGAALMVQPSLIGLGSAFAVAGAGSVVAAIPSWRRRRDLRADRDDAATGHRDIAHAVAVGLAALGAGPADPVIRVDARGDATAVWLDQAGDADQRRFRAALVELVSPVRSPRFLLEVDRGHARDPLTRWALALAARSGDGVLLPVPREIGRRRAGAEAFATAWNERIGPAVLHELSGPDDVVLLTRARRASATGRPAPFARDVWA